MTSDGRSSLPNSSFCFVCGEDNPAGLQVKFYVEGDVVKADLRPQDHHCGYAETTHGGISAAILDETMGWAANRALKRMCVTADLSVRYLKPVSVHKKLTVCAEATRVSKRIVKCRAWIEDADGDVYVRGEGRFTPLTIEQTLEVDAMLRYGDGDERLFEELRGGDSGT